MQDFFQLFTPLSCNFLYGLICLGFLESGCHFDRISDQRENGLGGHFDKLSDRWGKFSDRTKETGPETGWLVTEPVGVIMLFTRCLQ